MVFTTATGIFIAILVIFIVLLFLALFYIIPIVFKITVDITKNWRGIK